MTDPLRQFVEEVARELGPAWYVDPFDRRDEVDVIHREAEFGQFRFRPMLGAAYGRVSVFGVLPPPGPTRVEVRDLSTSLNRPAAEIADWIREVLPGYVQSLAAVREFNAKDRPTLPVREALDAGSEGSDYPRAGNASPVLSPAQHPADGMVGVARMGRGGKTNVIWAVLRDALGLPPVASGGSFVVLVTDPRTGVRFAYGPYPGTDAALRVSDQLRSRLGVESLDDLVLEVQRLIPLAPEKGGA